MSQPPPPNQPPPTPDSATFELLTALVALMFAGAFPFVTLRFIILHIAYSLLSFSHTCCFQQCSYRRCCWCPSTRSSDTKLTSIGPTLSNLSHRQRYSGSSSSSSSSYCCFAAHTIRSRHDGPSWNPSPPNEWPLLRHYCWNESRYLPRMVSFILT